MPDETWLTEFLRQILDALQTLHLKQCFHRDISPDNILTLDGMTPLLLDFGAVRHVLSDKTQALTIILKPGYAPIEQYGDSMNLHQGPWTDIYALGSVQYFAKTGRVPPVTLARILNDPIVLLSLALRGKNSSGFLQALDLSLKFKPEHWPQCIQDFQVLLGLKRASLIRNSNQISGIEIINNLINVANTTQFPDRLTRNSQHKITLTKIKDSASKHTINSGKYPKPVLISVFAAVITLFFVWSNIFRYF